MTGYTLEHLRAQGFSHPGFQHILMLQDLFEHEGPNGRHIRLITKIMGESMSTFQRSFPNAQIPSPFVQRFAKQLLQAILVTACLVQLVYLLIHCDQTFLNLYGMVSSPFLPDSQKKKKAGGGLIRACVLRVGAAQEEV